LLLSCEVVENKVVLGTRFLAGGYTHNFEHAFLNRTCTSEHVVVYAWVPFSEFVE